MTGPDPGGYDIEAIMRRLPHRYPLLMVDRIEESGPGYAIGIKNVTANEPCFQGHFPGRAVMPGTLIVEALMQTSAFVGRTGRPGEDDAAAPYADEDRPDRRLGCVGMNMKFRKPVVPGDRLRMEVRLERMIGDMVWIRATAHTEAGIVACGDLMLAGATTTELDRPRGLRAAPFEKFDAARDVREDRE